MNELLKKASLTVASMCLVAGGLVSVGWAGQNEGERARHMRLSAASAENKEKQQAMPDELEIDGKTYRKVGCDIHPRHHDCRWPQK